MWNRRAVVSGLAVAAVGLVGACADRPPTQPEAQADDPTAVFSAGTAAVEGPQTLDAVFARMAREIPGFGGLFYDEDGKLNVYMARGQAREMTSTRQLADALGGRLQALGLDAVSAEQLVVRSAQYDFVELNAWHQRVRPVLAMPGVVFTDVDETTNRLRIGVEQGVSEAQIGEAVQALGVPRDAVIVSETEPIVPLQEWGMTTRDKFRPVPGGVQIHGAIPDVGTFRCTLGFNLRAPALTRQQFFMTNSHCTAERGVVLPTEYWQHSRFEDDTFIGWEVFDPPYFTGGACPTGWQCRWSDAAVAQYAIPRAQVQFARIARPIPGAIVLPDPNARFTIVDEARSRVVVGQGVGKVGSSTGLTGGPVSQTCFNSTIGGLPGVAMLCQDRILMPPVGGDSGSPVFEPIDLADPARVRLQGILWGGTSLTAIFSHMLNIRAEIPGPWITH
ncbi:MAG: hypothetical protein H0W11_03230 [Gemmatimonadetes bacterium]|nr:hypothetical protein [Gemmatimonadota bacterium]